MYFKQIDAIVNGTKTQTRRVVKPNEIGDRWQVDPTRYFDVHTLHNNESRRHLKWRVGRDYAVSPGRGLPGVYVNFNHPCYSYDVWKGTEPVSTDKGLIDWREFAPRQGYHPLRIRLLKIRREPLQAISEEDAVAEGYRGDFIWPHRVIDKSTPSPIEWYRALWKEINGPKSWDTTDNVWALTFEVVR